MSKKHFQALADALRKGKPDKTLNAFALASFHQWKMTVQDVANVCAQDNPRFDRSRFLRACGMED